MTGIVSYDRANASRVDRQYAAPSLVLQRIRTLQAMALRPGQRVLDIGCGPGYLTAEIAGQVGAKGRVVAIDTSRPMLDIARERCAGLGTVEFHRASAESLPFPEASFDVAAAVQVYLFVADPERSIRELARVLRPGGTAVVVDTDWDSVVWRSSDCARMDRLLRAWCKRFANARTARILPGLLSRTGMKIGHIEAIPLVELAPDEISYSGSQIAELARYVTATGEVAADEAQAWQQDLRLLAEKNEYFFSLNRYLFAARKPH